VTRRFDRPPSPAELSAAAKAVSDAVNQRDRLIRASVAAGHSLRAIGKFVGLSHEQVRKIAARGAEGGDK
jgi:transposase